MRSSFSSVAVAFLSGVFVVTGCSSSSDGHKADAAGGTGGMAATGGSAGLGGGAGGGTGGAGAGTAVGTGGTSGASSTGGAGGTSQSRPDASVASPDGGQDIGKSAECTAYCAKVRACGASCDPATDCAAPSGSCDEAHRAYLGCEAATGSFSCSPDGFAVISDCHEDPSACPAVPVVDAGSCDLTPPDPTCAACAKTTCSTAYNALHSDPELADFTDCVKQCEQLCEPATACPAECEPYAESAFSAYTNLLYCAVGNCNSCTTATVIF